MVVIAIYKHDGELVGADVQHSDDREGVMSDVIWPDGFEGWSCGVRDAVPLDKRPPKPERDERSEVERLREEVEGWQAAFEDVSDSADELCAEAVGLRAEVERLREEVRAEAAYSARHLLELVVGSDVIREWDHGPYEFGHHPWCEHTEGVPRLVTHGVMRWTGETYGRWRVAELVDARCREAVDAMRFQAEQLREHLEVTTTDANQLEVAMHEQANVIREAWAELPEALVSRDSMTLAEAVRAALEDTREGVNQ